MPENATAPAPQHMQALAQANKVRLARAELKRQVADGELSVADVVLNCPWEAGSMTIADLLMSQHRWGRTRCRRFLTQLSMNARYVPPFRAVGRALDRAALSRVAEATLKDFLDHVATALLSPRAESSEAPAEVAEGAASA